MVSLPVPAVVGTVEEKEREEKKWIVKFNGGLKKLPSYNLPQIKGLRGLTTGSPFPMGWLTKSRNSL